VANGESVIIDGMVSENFSISKRSVASQIYVSSDMTGLISGVDWLRRQGKVGWDF